MAQKYIWRQFGALNRPHQGILNRDKTRKLASMLGGRLAPGKLLEADSQTYVDDNSRIVMSKSGSEL